MNSLSQLSKSDKVEIVQVGAEKARRHLMDYCKIIDRNYQPAAHLKLLTDRLEALERGDINRLMVFMPPRHGKSETVSKKFPSWYFGRNPDHSIIMSSYAHNLVRSFSRDVRDTIESQRYKVMFNIHTAEDSRSVNEWNIGDHDGGMIAAGVGGAVTGYGANLFIIDDPVKNKEEAESLVYRERVWGWYQSVVLTRLEPGAKIVLVMTRWHKDDLAGRILEKEPATWEVINLQALSEGKDLLMRSPGTALWPSRFNEKTLETTKDRVGSRVWHALFQGNPLDPESQIIRRDWIKWYDDLPPGCVRGGGIDTATSKNTTADNMALVDVCCDKEGFLYCDDAVCEKLTVSAFAKHNSNQHKIKKYIKIKIESNNAGEAVKQRIDEVGREDKTYPPVEAVPTSTDKVVRVMGFQALIENGTLKFKRGNKKVAELVEHLIAFDGKGGEVDDDVDALGFAIKAVTGDDIGLALTLNYDVRPD
jgi:predicted phage terminase large subunit-like protein